MLQKSHELSIESGSQPIVIPEEIVQEIAPTIDYRDLVQDNNASNSQEGAVASKDNGNVKAPAYNQSSGKVIGGVSTKAIENSPNLIPIDEAPVITPKLTHKPTPTNPTPTITLVPEPLPTIIVPDPKPTFYPIPTKFPCHPTEPSWSEVGDRINLIVPCLD